MSKFDLSQRRACHLLRVDAKTVRRMPVVDHPEIRALMRDIAAERRRFGYWRIGLMLEREGITMNHKKLRCLYREEGVGKLTELPRNDAQLPLDFRLPWSPPPRLGKPAL